ncbi:MAG: hypothetical protein M1827_001747 [Pycnora praestabilis]|nr:MAG: hypothetical protein M1827_001747 [Pycnora praestabilis]
MQEEERLHEQVWEVQRKKLLALLGFIMTVVIALLIAWLLDSVPNAAACGEATTIFVTVSPIAAEVPPAVTATITTEITLTRVVVVVPAPSDISSVTAGPSEGPYYFSEDEGTTFWLSDKVPATTASLAFGTTTVIVFPEPVSSSSAQDYSASPIAISSSLTSVSTLTVIETLLSENPPTSTLWSASAVSSGILVSPAQDSTPSQQSATTVTIFETLIPTAEVETSTETVDFATTSARSYTGYGIAGWNTTATTLQTVKVSPIGSGVSPQKKPTYKDEVAVTHAQILQTGGYAKPSTGDKKKRVATEWVTAAIDGTVVSWVNNWSGYGGEVSTSPSSTVDPSISITSASATLSTVSSTTVIHQISPPTSSTSTIIIEVSELPTSTQVISTSSAATPLPSHCGEYGNFTLNFDDLPRFSPTNNDTASFPPIFNPYHHLFFSGGFAYAPPPTDPFPPISPPLLAIFVANVTASEGSLVTFDNGNPYTGDEAFGEFGAGPRLADSAYWVDVYSAYVGCDNGGPDDCTITFDGFTYGASTDEEVLAVSQTFTFPPCPGFVDCHLTLVELGEGFRGLTGIRMLASVAGVPKIWFMDNVQMTWSNNTCAAGLERQESR